MAVRIVSWNVNSLRSAMRHGFIDWLETDRPDIVCLQEVRAELKYLRPLEPLFNGYKAIWHPAEKPGYSGVGILTRLNPVSIDRGLDNQPDPEGRSLTVDFGDFRVSSLYAPNANPGTPKIEAKCNWLKGLVEHVSSRNDKPIILAGDYNVALAAADSFASLSIPMNGCTEEEREAFNRLFTECQLTDPMRAEAGNQPLSTWWSGTSPEHRLASGMRYDYILTSSSCRDRVSSPAIHDNVFGSDHCPTSLLLNVDTDHLPQAQSAGQQSLI